MTLVLTPLATDNFTPNANPLNPAKWQSLVSSGLDNLEAVSGTARPTNASQSNCAESFIGIVPPANQYVTATLASWVPRDSQLAILAIRATSDLSDGYTIVISDNGDGTSTISFGSETGTGTTFFENDNATVSVGDVYTLAAVGTTIFAYQNGVLLTPPVTNSDSASGQVILALISGADGNTDASSFSNFITGSAQESSMPATTFAMYSQNSSQSGTTVAGAWPQVTPNGVGNQNLDLLQIVGIGGKVLLNVDYQGTVHNPAVTPTNGTRIGVFQTRLTSAATTAQFFADAFSNPSQQDILQVINAGGNIHYYLNYQGVATGS